MQPSTPRPEPPGPALTTPVLRRVAAPDDHMSGRAFWTWLDLQAGRTTTRYAEVKVRWQAERERRSLREAARGIVAAVLGQARDLHLHGPSRHATAFPRPRPGRTPATSPELLARATADAAPVVVDIWRGMTTLGADTRADLSRVRDWAWVLGLSQEAGEEFLDARLEEAERILLEYSQVLAVVEFGLLDLDRVTARQLNAILGTWRQCAAA
jgi:hypothetical protein